MIHFDHASRRALSVRVGWLAWRLLLVGTFLSVVIGVGLASSDPPLMTQPAPRGSAVAVWDDGPAEVFPALIRETPSDPLSFIIADPRSASAGAAHLLMPALGVTLLWFGLIRPLSVDMPILPVRRWKGRTLGVPLHRGPPVLAR